jgi:hypothetical protein
MLKRNHRSWKEPQTLKKAHLAKLIFWNRLVEKHLVSFLAGFITILIGGLFAAGLPDTIDSALFLLALCLFTGFLFALIYGVAASISPKVVFREKNITWQYIEESKKWDYSELVNFNISEKSDFGKIIRMLILSFKENESEEFEISDEITNEQISTILQSKLS